MKFARVSALVSVLAVSCSAADALTYSFSFGNEEGNVAGTVEGLVVLEDGDGTKAATSVLVTNAPGSLGWSTPLDVFAAASSISLNSFVVSGGEIVGADFIALYTVSGGGTAGLLALSVGSVDNSFLPGNGTSAGTLGVMDRGSESLVFEPVTPVPLPAAGLFLGTALAAGGVAARRRTRG